MCSIVLCDHVLAQPWTRVAVVLCRVLMYVAVVLSCVLLRPLQCERVEEGEESKSYV